MGIKLSFENCIIKKVTIKSEESPVFEHNFNLPTGLSKFKHYHNILIIASGGSRTSFYAYYTALKKLRSDKEVIFLDTNEPDYLHLVKKQCKKKDTLVIPISKSGNTVTVLETMSFFKGYDMLAVTNPSEGALQKICEKEGIHIMEHPKIGGRYSGRTATAYVPSIILGIDVNQIEKGAANMISQCRGDDNPALKVASVLFDLEKKGYTEVFTPFYSTKLFGFYPILVQLMHESVCKEGKGQSFYGDLGPECQHHTNQRFFGGRKNCIGLFFTQKSQDSEDKIEYEKSILDVELGQGKIRDINGILYKDAFKSEFVGTYRDAAMKGIPLINIEVEKVDEDHCGQLITFLHYLAYYSSVLRKVNPFDQPQVENSKKISFSSRLKKSD
ncbi:hypothetical protein K9M79_07130 [Candidatus Woesearchaeota archaeon]|nr:hypothetical protein [Candidatus Woesearchaeota archaeon]